MRGSVGVDTRIVGIRIELLPSSFVLWGFCYSYRIPVVVDVSECYESRLFTNVATRMCACVCACMCVCECVCYIYSFLPRLLENRGFRAVEHSNWSTRRVFRLYAPANNRCFKGWDTKRVLLDSRALYRACPPNRAFELEGRKPRRCPCLRRGPRTSRTGSEIDVEKVGVVL